MSHPSISRRRFLAGASAAGIGFARAGKLLADEPAADVAADPDKALIAITLDLEMSRHYPTWDVMHWDYEKGNLNEPAKQYTREACRRVKAKGGVLQSFVLGRVFEQENVDWLKEIVAEGHPVGNHTYDHVNVWTKSTESLQFRFQRAPWLIEGKTPREVILENIRLTDLAMKTRIGVAPVGFRTPGGNGSGLIGRPDVEQMMLDSGFTWVSSMAKSVPIKPENPTDEDFQRVAEAQKDSQPFVYPTGLVEIPMSPLGDVASFRREKEKWKIGDFLKMIERSVEWTIEHRAVFDLLGHPSIMYVEDPEFRAYELICDMVNQAGGRAAIVGLDTIARRVKLRHKTVA
ncbi:MAG: polysaccharide deacetylase family protein [Planctomycetota bacterium]